MNNEFPLFARHSDPFTSHVAMKEYDRGRLSNAVDFVVSLYALHGDMPDYRLKELFDRNWSSQCCDHLYRQARSVARDRGKIVDTGKYEINPKTNRKQVVWGVASNDPVVIQKCATCGHVLRRKENTKK